MQAVLHASNAHRTSPRRFERIARVVRNLAALVLFCLSLPALANVDLVVNVTDNPDPVAAGAVLTYTVGVDNSGSDPVTAVNLSATLPAGATFVSATPPAGDSCSEAAGTVSCTLGAMNVGGHKAVAIAVRPAATGVVTLTATATSTPADDTDANNNTGIAQSTTVSDGANLNMAVTAAPATLHAGQQTALAVTVANGGPSAANGTLTVTLPLPAGVAYLSGGGGGWTCTHNPGTNTVTATRSGPLVSGASSAFTVNVRPDVSGNLAFAPSVAPASATPDPVLDDNTAVVQIQSDPGMDLSLRKTATPASALVGADVTYTLTARYVGSVAPSDISITDTLPAQLSYVSAAGTGWSCSQAAGTVTCTRAAPGVGPGVDMPAVTIHATAVTAGAGIVNTAVAAATAPADDNPANDSATAAVTIADPSADLSTTKTVWPAAVAAGDTATFTITVRNSGNAAATGTITVVDTLPAGWTYVSATGSGWTCNASAGTVTCTRAGPLNSNSTAPVIQIGAIAPASAGAHVNTACQTNTHGPAESNASNDCGSATITVSSQTADLAIVKTASPGTIQAGDLLTYTLAVTNNGPDAANDVIVSDTVSSFSGTPTATASQGACSVPGSGGTRNIVCNLGSLANGASANVTISLRPTAAGTRSNTGSTYATTIADPNYANNTSTATSIVNPDADVAVSITRSPTNPIAGTQVTYTVTATNQGPSQAADITLSTLPLPPDVEFVSVSAPGASCGYPANPQCVWGPTNSGTARTMTLVVRPRVPGTLTLDASAASNTADRNPANNSASNSVVVGAPSFDLLINKTDSPDPVPVGGNVTYTVRVTNNGPSLATGVVITDTPPAALQVISVSAGSKSTGGSFACTTPALPYTGGAPYTCAVGDLEPGATATFTSVMTTGTAGVYTNTASVTADQPEAVAGNNTVSENTTFKVPADLSLTKTVAPQAVNIGGQVVFTITVANGGPAATSGVQVADALPAGYTYVSATASQGDYTPGTGLWNVGALANGATANLRITATVNATGSYVNVAEIVASSVPDPDSVPGNHEPNEDDQAQASILPPGAPAADLSITKTDGRTTYTPGAAVTYTIVASNAGPNAVTGAAVADTLPAAITGATWTVVYAGGASGPASGSGDIAAAVNLPVGASASFTVTGTVAADATGDLVNTATIATPAGTTDPNPANNSATDTDTQSAPAAPHPIPALTPAMLALLAGLIAVSAMLAQRRRVRRRGI